MNGDNPVDGDPRRPASEPLIVAHDQEVVIEHHPEDWLAFVLFWALAIIVFLQFYTRYILNDSLSWTEEIARYGLMWITFIGGAIVVRKKTNIAVELLLQFSSRRVARVLLAIGDVTQLFFIALLAYFSIEITDRMSLQIMTVVDWPMSWVYAGIAFGCFLMLARQIQKFWQNARDGWRRAAESIGDGLIID
ncbi:MAG: TRAP transporter small permease [Pseudolabrys sp.]|jgi:TRAP-type C4-dicarboxylate transport system permease small subunit|nr:TRAP transporter small permease [Pseudolabrys sp.]